MKYSIRQYFFWSVVSLMIVSVVIINILGEKQDKSFLENFQQYSLAKQMLNEKNTSLAIDILLDLEDKHANRFNIYWDTGLSYGLSGEYNKAAKYFQKALDQRPFLLREPIFVLQFGEILFFNGEYSKSKLFLEECKKLPLPENYQPRVDELLNLIDAKEKEGAAS